MKSAVHILALGILLGQASMAVAEDDAGTQAVTEAASFFQQQEAVSTAQGESATGQTPSASTASNRVPQAEASADIPVAPSSIGVSNGGG